MPLISAYDFTFDETFSSFSIAERTALSLSSFEDFFRSSFIAIVVYRISLARSLIFSIHFSQMHP